jgi:hypothetical protein
MQLAQMLGGGGRGAQSGQYQPYTSAAGSIPNALFQNAAGLPQYFQPQNNSRTSSAANVLGGGGNAAQPQLPTRPEQVLGQYYTSLCQPSFPTISESQINSLGMFPVSRQQQKINFIYIIL